MNIASSTTFSRRSASGASLTTAPIRIRRGAPIEEHAPHHRNRRGGKDDRPEQLRPASSGRAADETSRSCAARGLLRRARVLIVEVRQVDLDRGAGWGAVRPRRSSAWASSLGERIPCSCARVRGAIRCMPESGRCTPSSPSLWTMVAGQAVDRVIRRDHPSADSMDVVVDPIVGRPRDDEERSQALAVLIARSCGTVALPYTHRGGGPSQRASQLRAIPKVVR